METENKLFHQIKSAAENAEGQNFPASEKVWSRVEEKLDNKVLASQNTLWKKIAVVACLLLVASVAYQLVVPSKQTVQPQNQTVTIDTLGEKPESTEQQGVAKETLPIKTDAPEMHRELIKTPATIVVGDSIHSKKQAAEATKHTAAPVSKNSGNWLGENNFESRGVVQQKSEIVESLPAQTPTKKDEPLYVVNGKATSKKDRSGFDENDLESVLVLPDPLYIINGMRYTEQEVFGPNPTSPYSPLSKQHIETITILQEEKAISIYGEKGKKGVVIITTKDGKPAAIKSR